MYLDSFAFVVILSSLIVSNEEEKYVEDFKHNPPEKFYYNE